MTTAAKTTKAPLIHYMPTGSKVDALCRPERWSAASSHGPLVTCWRCKRAVKLVENANRAARRAS